MVDKLSYFQKLVCAILKKGKIPNHIAFIMDGNRRYAKNIGKSCLKGYQYGVQALKKCLLMCSQLGVKIISLYCFSMQNFNRSAVQVQKLMNLAQQVFVNYSPVSHILQQKSIKVRIVGNVQKLKQSVSKGLKQVQQRTKQNKGMIVNLCFAYDSFYEINLALKKSGKQCTYQQFKSNLLIQQDVDVMVRTSNESRLSNFLLAQSRYSHYVGLKQNWPQLSWVSFIQILMQYNYHFKNGELIKKQKQMHLKVSQKLFNDSKNDLQQQ